jgi:succinyl-diaminopimelate desuccinylase
VGKARVGAIFSTDEELGGFTTKHMVRKGYAGTLILIADGGGYRVGYAQKGRLAVWLRAKGKAAHGAAPWRGANAFDLLIEGYRKVRKLFPPLREGDEWHDTASANVVRAGDAMNRVPDKAEMFLDIRYTGETPKSELVRRIRAASGLTVEAKLVSPQLLGDKNDAHIAALIDFMEQHLGREIDTVRLNGATDARHFVKLRRPIAIIGVPSRGAHAANEAVNIKGLERYRAMLRDYCIAHAPA